VTLAERVAAEDGARLRSFGTGAPGRFVREVAGLTVVAIGVEESWGVQIEAMGAPVDAGAVGEAVAWCRVRQLEPLVRIRACDRDALPAYDLVEELPVLVGSTDGTQDTWAVEAAGDLTEFRLVYATSFGMSAELAARLVVAADLAAHPHLLGRVDGLAVACAQLRLGGDMAYVNGVGVLPSQRARGFGAAMMTACGAAAGERGCELIWLHASGASLGFYEAIGFELVDTHLALAPS
jgi:ribosomal protein S18 acetylase RimI-like enzyme